MLFIQLVADGCPTKVIKLGPADLQLSGASPASSQGIPCQFGVMIKIDHYGWGSAHDDE